MGTLLIVVVVILLLGGSGGCVRVFAEDTALSKTSERRA
jgi:hypothetical protein